MVNTKSKGRKHEKEAMDVYEAMGARTWHPANSSRAIGPGKFISESQDIAECFDFMAWKEFCIDFVQVKSQESHASEARKAIDELGMPPPSKDICYIVLMRMPRKPRRFIQWVKDGYGIWHRGTWPSQKQIEDFAELIG